MYISFRYLNKSLKLNIEIPITYDQLVEAASVDDMYYCLVVERVWFRNQQNSTSGQQGPNYEFIRHQQAPAVYVSYQCVQIESFEYQDWKDLISTTILFKLSMQRPSHFCS